MADTEQPLSNLDAAVDELCVALARTPDLEGLIEGISLYAHALPFLPVDDPLVVDALSVAPVWAALAKTASEVLALRKESDGDTP